MKTLTMNKGNWSGETATVRHGKNVLYVYGERYVLKRKRTPLEDLPAHVQIDVFDRHGHYPIVTCSRFEDDAYWTAHGAHDPDFCVRTDGCEYRAIAMVLFNIV